MRRTLFESVTRPPLTEPAPAPTDPELAALAAEIKSATSMRLGRSLAIRHVDAGSCNACELEIHALSNAFYDIERFGFRFVASPRHADVLLVTGPVTRNMQEALRRLRARRRLVRGWLCLRGRRRCRDPGGLAYTGLPSNPDGPAQRLARTDCRKRPLIGSPLSDRAALVGNDVSSPLGRYPPALRNCRTLLMPPCVGADGTGRRPRPRQ
jgi:hypothetical protein